MSANLYEYLTDYWKSNPKCKECGHTFPDEPQTVQSYVYVILNGRQTSQPKPKAQFDAEFAKYQEDQKIWERVVKDHLTTHPNGECKFCGSVVKRSGLKSHQKSYTCQENQRKASLEERGYLDVENDYALFHSIFIQMKKTILRGTDWDDGPERRFIERECTRAIETFEDLGNIHRCFTDYRPIRHGPSVREEDCGWQLRAFAPTDTAIALRQCLKSYRKLDRDKQNFEALMVCFYEMWEWLHMDEDGRGAAVGGWELATQSV